MSASDLWGAWWPERYPGWRSSAEQWSSAAPHCSGSPKTGWQDNQTSGKRKIKKSHCWQSGTRGKHTRRTSSTSPKTNITRHYIILMKWQLFAFIVIHIFYLKGIFLNGFDHIFEEDLWGESVSMVNDRVSIWSIPAVQLHTAAALQKCSMAGQCNLVLQK